MVNDDFDCPFQLQVENSQKDNIDESFEDSPRQITKKKSFSDVPESIWTPENDTKYTRYDPSDVSNKYKTNSDFKLI